MRKKKKKTKRKYYLCIEVLQNGVVVCEDRRILRGKKTLRLGPSKKADLPIPLYTMPHDIELLTMNKDRVILDLDASWSGFAKTYEGLIDFDPGDRAFKSIELKNSDYASLVWRDLQILIKITSQEPAVERIDPHVAQQYRPSLISLLWPDQQDVRHFVFSAVICLLGLALPSYMALRHLPAASVEEFEDLHPDYLLPFIYSRHLKNSPEYLQHNLDRTHYERSVIRFFKNFAAMLLNWDIKHDRYLFSNSVQRYRNYFTEQQSRIKEIYEQQIYLNQQILEKPQSAMIALPVVRGESLRGQILRVFDKIDYLHQASEQALANRRQFTPIFIEEESDNYNYFDYNSNAKSKESQEKLAQIKPFHMLTNEQVMYKKAEDLAYTAAKIRSHIHKRREPDQSLSEDSLAAVGLDGAVDFVSFITNGSMLANDDKINNLIGVYYGDRKKQKVEEPLIGELDPNLIRRYVAKRRYQLQLCYELALRRNRQLSGRMEWSWRIDSRGKISNISLKDTTIRDPKMAQCIRKKLAQWRFPRPKRGSVQASYSFEFNKDKG